MEFFKHNTRINFMGQRKKAMVLSVILFALSLISLGMNGLNWGLDFTGGTQIQLHFPNTADINHIRDSLQTGGFKNAIVISYGTKNLKSNTADAVENAEAGKDELVGEVLKLLPDAKVQQVSYIGPQVGQELASRGLLAIVVALLATMTYIAIRFEFRFAVGSTVALVHDPILILGIFSFLHLEFNLITLAGVLTVIGYSLNDTIVIFDRVRENFRKLRKASPVEVINQATNETLSRTIMTSALTLTVCLALFFMGGSMLHGFALALIIGIVIGTYSSIYVAGSLALALGLRRQHLLPPPKAVLDERP
jgi:preprotein translocase subunit SecF